jgi:hypothetical protein
MHRLWADKGVAGDKYHLAMRLLCKHMCPEGLADVWFPSEQQQADFNEGLTHWERSGSVKIGPEFGASEVENRGAAKTRGHLWSGEMNILSFASANFEGMARKMEHIDERVM